jgi:hypothetical protein
MSDLTGALAHKLVRGSEIFPLMSAWGQSRRFHAPPVASGYPLTTDIARPAGLVRFMPKARLKQTGWLFISFPPA